MIMWLLIKVPWLKKSSEVVNQYNRRRLIWQHYTEEGLSSTALQWMTSYLTDRQQCVRQAGSSSKSTIITCGVPQGSVLVPILFLLYTADILTIIFKHGLQGHFYADDSHRSMASVVLIQLMSRIFGPPQRAASATLPIGWNAIDCSSIHPNRNFSGARLRAEWEN